MGSEEKLEKLNKTCNNNNKLVLEIQTFYTIKDKTIYPLPEGVNIESKKQVEKYEIKDGDLLIKYKNGEHELIEPFKEGGHSMGCYSYVKGSTKSTKPKIKKVDSYIEVQEDLLTNHWGGYVDDCFNDHVKLSFKQVQEELKENKIQYNKQKIIENKKKELLKLQKEIEELEK